MLYLLEIKYLSIITSQKNETDIADEKSQLFNYSSMKNMFALLIKWKDTLNN